jgi:hypothetical protein
MSPLRARQGSTAVELILLCTMVLSACAGPATTPAPDVPTSGADSATAAPSPTATSGPEMRTVYRLGEGEVQEPVPPPATLDAVLDDGVEAGSWDYGEGLIFMLRFVSGELAPEAIPGFEAPSEFSPTGIVRQAQDYLSDPDSDPQYRDEITRLLGILVPDQDRLDQLSQPATSSSRSGITLASFQRQTAPPPECADLASMGFNAGINPGDYCYLFQEATVEGSRLRVYYPKWWQDDPTRMSWANAALQSLSKSAATYSQFGTYGDVNAVFSLTQLLSGLHTLAFETAFPANSPCPVVILPLVYTDTNDAFLQTVAHEAFHCYQDWNFNMSPYQYHRWWAEGSAEYFSNVVYPNVNYEIRRTGAYYDRSITDPWFDLDYLNFLLFQFLANKLGNEGLLIMLNTVSSAGNVQAQAQALANYGDLDDLFEEFVVATMSTGVRDTGGTMIISHSYSVLPKTFEDEGDQQFVVNPFVAGRFVIHYQKERRFEQEPEENENVRHSAAISEERHDLNAWSKLPPEVRSKCEDNQDYVVAVTSVDGPGILTAKVNKVEEADCDPCLLGTWAVDGNSYANYLKRVFASGGQSVDIYVGGKLYLQFKEDGDLATRRDGLEVSTSIANSPSLVTTIDGQGSGEYSSDGDSLTFTNVSSVTNKVKIRIEGVEIPGGTGSQMGTFGLFDGPPRSSADGGPTSHKTGYTCELQTLEMDFPQFGQVTFNRVDEIIPTPIPTAGP